MNKKKEEVVVIKIIRSNYYNAPKIDPVLVVEYVQTTRIGPNIGDPSNGSVAIS